MKNKFLKKNSLVALLALCLLGMLFAGCNKKSPVLIPDNAVAVTHFNIKNLFVKGDFKSGFIKDAMEDLKKEDEETYEIINDLIKHPRSCGLKVTGNVFTFVEMSANFEPSVTLGMEVRRGKKFRKYLEKLEQKKNLNFNIKKLDDYYTANFENLGWCWNNSKVYLFFPVDSKDVSNRAEKLMTLTEDESLYKNSNYNTFLSNKHDYGVFFNFKPLINLYKQVLSSYSDEQPEGVDATLNAMKDASLALLTNFEKGYINTKYEILGMDEKKFEQFTKSFNKDIINYLPQQTIAATTFSFNIDAVVEQLVKTTLVDPSAAEILNEKVLGTDYTITNLIDSFNGSFAISLSDAKTENVERRRYNYDYDYDYEYGYGAYDTAQIYDYPHYETYTAQRTVAIFTFVADLSNGDTFKGFFDQLSEDGILTRTGDAYVFTLDDLNISIKVNNNTIIISNEEVALNAFSTGGTRKGIEKIAAEAQKGNYLYVNLDFNAYPTSAKELLTDRAGKKAIDLVSNFLNDVEVKQLSNTAAEININLKDKDKNSLSAFFDFCGEVKNAFLGNNE